MQSENVRNRMLLSVEKNESTSFRIADWFFPGPPPPRPWGPPPPWHRPRGPPPFGPPPPWDRPPPPWRRPPWHRRPPWDFPPPPPPPPPPEPQQDQPQVMFSQDIDKVVNSVNQNTAAFQRPGESYDKVIQLMSSYFNRKSGSQYDMNAVIPSNGIPNNEMNANSKIAAIMFESDMALTVAQMNKVAQNGFRVKRKMNLNGTTWSTSIAYRFLDTDATWQSQITNALRYYERNSCIRFLLNGAGADYIAFNRGEGCYSSVGKLGGAQEISIGYGCETLGIITHEVGHALGFWHEQARPERDSYVRINRQNAINGLEGQFDKRSWSEVNEYSLPYDYGSVMHYGPKSFSRSSTLNTVEPVDAAFINTIGNRVEPSFLDLKLLNTAFCSNMCTNRINCQHGGYPDPNNCEQCKCPTGLEGTYCERLQTSNCGVELPRADYNWRNISYSGSSDCYWRITAANGGNVRFEITYVMYRCSPVCEEFVEIKAEYSHEATGYRQCCRAVLGERISKGNSVLIISKATANSQFVLRYRADGTPPAPRPAPVTAPAPRSFSLQWSGWTGCSENCGSCGTQYRTRCTSTTNCSRPVRQTRVCNTQPCAQGTTRGKRSVLETQMSPRVKRYGEWCCARFVLSRGVCVPVRGG
ncbi:CBN-NAS-33 protein [Caenorhabditis brenneri]|uniref:Zinc metalloproteinase n=1 Tax=Caenorhabditis brenneri TaxID=135651 RepID=G0MSQ7_CAEBE|nr:CBN-NAS-33 protein [Caenorhabditis brenneri]